MKGSTLARRSAGSAWKSSHERMRQNASMPSSMARVKNGPIGSTSAPAASKRSAAARTAARDLGVDRQAAAGVEQQADPQAAHVALEPRPGDVLGGRLIVSRSSGCASTLIISAASATVRVIGPATRPA